VCGERGGRIRLSGPCGGSSPRVRGTLPYGGAEAPRDRFIPACAGNALVYAAAAVSRSVHPRVCGERGRRMHLDEGATGSSPRVRGTRIGSGGRGGGTRFIPACAGNAHQGENHTGDVTVHPRVCGERREALAAAERGDGSSPRVRGTRAEESCRARQVRFIPACAGNARLPPNPWRPVSVHPRVCGERSSTVSLVNRNCGSSPRVRGTRNASWAATPGPGFIPACAGNARARR